MARVIHSRRIPTGMRFREWDPAKSRYATDELSQPLMREYLLASGTSVDVTDIMIRRALVSGTSDPTSKHDADKPWEAEKDEAAAPAAKA